MKFDVLVFNLIKKIPRGRVVTYKQIATAAGIKNPRIVGDILHGNSDPAIFPCHRVVRADGTIAKGFAFGGQKGQIKLLKKEGIIFKNGKVDLKKYLFTLP